MFCAERYVRVSSHETNQRQQRPDALCCLQITAWNLNPSRSQYHYRPLHGLFGRPDLETVYANLYLCCGECNTSKSDIWSDEESYACGERFIDPCEDWGDHDLHWRFETDGTLTPLTPEGTYTNDVLMLWREFLVDRRAQQSQDQQALDVLYAELAATDLPEPISFNTLGIAP